MIIHRATEGLNPEARSWIVSPQAYKFGQIDVMAYYRQYEQKVLKHYARNNKVAPSTQIRSDQYVRDTAK